MSAGWEIGDLAVCVPNECTTCCTEDNPNNGLGETVRGRSYVVAGFSRFKCPQGEGLILEGVRNTDFAGRVVGHCQGRFRKIRPDEQEGSAADWELILDCHTRKQPVAA